MRSPLGRRSVITAFLMLLAALGVASADAAACPNETRTGFRSYLLDCRAYELVSPAYKEGFPVFAQAISQSGEQLRVESFGSFASPENTSRAGQSYRVARDKSGWESSVLDAPFSTFPTYHVQGMSAEFESSLWFANAPGQFSEDVYLDSVSGPLVRIGPGAPPGVRGELTFVGASDDLFHILLLDHSPGGTEEDRLWPGDTTTSVGGRHSSLYEYQGTGNSEPSLVGVSNEETIEETAHREEELKHEKLHINEAAKLISNCGTSLGSVEEGDAYNAVSRSGATVFFTAEACGGSPAVNEVYARIGGKRTVAISEPSKEDCGKCETFEAEPTKRSSAIFQGASGNGSKVFFLSEQKLLPGARGDNLYEYNFNPEEDGRKADEKVSLIASMMSSSGEEAGGVARVSEDGSHVYFVAESVLTVANGEGRSPVVDEPNMYVFESVCSGGEIGCGSRVEHVSFVATLSREDEGDWSSNDVRPVQATPDGNFVVFQSRADLTNDQEGRAEAGQVFEYNAQTETLVRISRGDNGYNMDGNTDVYPATIPVQKRIYSSSEEDFKQLAVSEDGSRVFFSSFDALTARALGGFNNVYEYHNGLVSLISDGHDVVNVEEHSATELIGADESGRDVFFTTADSLVPQDGDTQVDIYDARENGGFAPTEELAPCSPGACKGPASEPLPLLAPVTMVAPEVTGSTTVASAPVKPRTKAKPVKGKKRKGKKARRKHKSTKKTATGK
jgi:hypothetical protein